MSWKFRFPFSGNCYHSFRDDYTSLPADYYSASEKPGGTSLAVRGNHSLREAGWLLTDNFFSFPKDLYYLVYCYCFIIIQFVVIIIVDVNLVVKLNSLIQSVV